MESDDIRWAVQLAARYVVTADVSYASGNPFARLDVYRPCDVPFQPCVDSPRPTLMFIHGGGWLDDASKTSYALWFLPFLQLGWVVVNVEYRSASAAVAPAALEDCLGALEWIACNAQGYNIDTRQLVIGGPSAGGLLALMVALTCSSLRPAAVINWCGIVDLVELTNAPVSQEFAVKWIGERPDSLELAKKLSPIHHVGEGSVPVVTIHGDQDLIVPYAQAVRFHEALTRAGVRNELITLRGSGHAFDVDASLSAYPGILGFLQRLGLGRSGNS